MPDMTLYEVSSGLIFIDDFTSLDSRWIASPVGSYSLTDRPGFFRMKHHLTQDTLLLASIPENVIAFEVHADYTPTVDGDQGGVVIWNTSEEKIEFLEKIDAERTTSQKNWMVLKDGTDLRFFSDEGNGYDFVDSDVMEATRFGVVLKRGTSTSFTDLDVDKVIVTRGNLLTVTNLVQGQKVQLLDSLGNVIVETPVIEGSAIQLRLPKLQIEGTLQILDSSDVLIDDIGGTFYGGDVYSIGTDIEIRKGTTELSKTEQTDLGDMIAGVLETQLNVYNPSIVSALNVNLAIAQYSSKFGWEWADIAPDVGGVAGAYGEMITIPELLPGQSIDFWIKVTKGTGYTGLEPLQFNIHLTQD
jgi:hypothetical protein